MMSIYSNRTLRQQWITWVGKQVPFICCLTLFNLSYLSLFIYLNFIETSVFNERKHRFCFHCLFIWRVMLGLWGKISNMTKIRIQRPWELRRAFSQKLPFLMPTLLFTFYGTSTCTQWSSWHVGSNIEHELCHSALARHWLDLSWA